jgi:hypothetical protein
MHIKFIPRGKGSAKSALIYVFQEHDNKGVIRQEIKLLRGNPEFVTAVADSLDFKHRYSSAVIAWHKDDQPTPQQIQEVLNEFENIAFAGLEGDQYCYYAVWHGEEDGSGHIHIISPRVELQSGKSLNIAPPGWEKTYDLIRDKFNEKYDWASPDTEKEPHRARIVNNTHIKHIDNTHTKAKKQINDAVIDLVQHRELSNAKEVEKFLESLPGVSVLPRRGDKSLSVKVEGVKKNIRLQGVAYERGFNIRELGGKLTAEKERIQRRKPADKERELSRLQGELDGVYGQRAGYHRGRYDKKIKESPKETYRDPKRDLQGREAIHTDTPEGKRRDRGGDRKLIGQSDKDQSETVDHSLSYRNINRPGAWHWIARSWEMDLKPVSRDKNIKPRDRGIEREEKEHEELQPNTQSIQQWDRVQKRIQGFIVARQRQRTLVYRNKKGEIDDRVRTDITKYIEDAKRTLQGGAVEHNQSIQTELTGYEEQVQQSDLRSGEHNRESESNIKELRRGKQEYSVQIGGSISTDIKRSSERLGRSSSIVENGIRARESRLQGLGGSIQRVAEWFRNLGGKAIDRSKKILSLLGVEKGRLDGGMRMKR